MFLSAPKSQQQLLLVKIFECVQVEAGEDLDCKEGEEAPNYRHHSHVGAPPYHQRDDIRYVLDQHVDEIFCSPQLQ